MAVNNESLQLSTWSFVWTDHRDVYIYCMLQFYMLTIANTATDVNYEIISGNFNVLGKIYSLLVIIFIPKDV